MQSSRLIVAALAALLLAAPATAHGALEINQFDTYAISDFEGHEDSFPWEGWEIWDVYVGDGYHPALGSHGVYFKANLAGDGTLRPTGSAVWQIDFSFRLGNETFTRTIEHDGAAVTSGFEAMEWQLADGNVFQVHAWVPVEAWEGAAVSELVVISSVDGQSRDIAPGGFYDPVTGTEVPFSAPATPVFPAMGEGRVVETVPLTGPGKFLEVDVVDDGPGGILFSITNPLAQQGQHVLFQAGNATGWSLHEAPEATSIDGGGSFSFALHLIPDRSVAALEPLRLDLISDIGGLRSYWAYIDGSGTVQLTEDAASTEAFIDEGSVDTPGAPIMGALAAIAVAAAGLRRRSA